MDTNAAYANHLNGMRSQTSCPMRESCYRAGTCELPTCERVDLVRSLDSGSPKPTAAPTKRGRPRAGKVKRLWKRCTKCGKVKSISEFGKDRGRPDMHASACRECYRAAYRAKRDAGKGRTKEDSCTI